MSNHTYIEIDQVHYTAEQLCQMKHQETKDLVKNKTKLTIGQKNKVELTRELWRTYTMPTVSVEEEPLLEYVAKGAFGKRNPFFIIHTIYKKHFSSLDKHDQSLAACSCSPDTKNYERKLVERLFITIVLNARAIYCEATKTDDTLKKKHPNISVQEWMGQSALVLFKWADEKATTANTSTHHSAHR